jgi:proteasome lid subunit RPN8/RPN11
MLNLLKRIRRLVDAHPNKEIGANIYKINGRYRLGKINKGTYYYVNIQENDLVIGQFHSHPNNTEASRGDWRSLVAPLEIIATSTHIWVAQFKSINIDWKNYICQFDKVEI